MNVPSGMRRILKKVVWILCFSLVLLALTSVLVWTLHPERRKVRQWRDDYPRIARGASEQEVIALMGPPTKIWAMEVETQKGPSNRTEETKDPHEDTARPILLWDRELVDEDTARRSAMRFNYNAGFAGIPLCYISVTFDEDGKAIGKHMFY